MKNRFFVLVTAFVLSLSSFGYEIIETNEMEDVARGATKQTLVVFDIDNTILEAAQSLGSVQWHDWYTAHLIEQGNDKDTAHKIATDEWIRINKVSGNRLVDQDTPGIIEGLQDRGIQVVALTARSPEIRPRTLEVLPTFDIHFEDSWDVLAKLINFPGSDYEKGVLFVGNNSKGKVLRRFMEQNDVRPSAVRFVDDKGKYLESVGPEMEAIGIEFTGYRYGGADEKVKNFDSRITDIQLRHFNQTGKLLTDKQAKKKLTAN